MSRRLALAFACSIALHEVAAAFFPLLPSHAFRREVIQHVDIVRIERHPLPTPPPPAPSPTPLPRRLVRQVHPVLVIQRQPHRKALGKAAHKARVIHRGAKRPTPPHLTPRTPAPAIPTGAQGAGAQNGSAAGSLAASTSNGNGTSTHATGSGSGAAPCGAVDFIAKGPATYDSRTGFYERSNIVAVVHYADGSSQSVPLNWVWRFRSEDLDPFNPSADAPMFFQFPPQALRASEPPAVQYIMKYSNPYGGTTLNADCPNIPPPPTPQD
jgi:hypothetical protein